MIHGDFGRQHPNGRAGASTSSPSGSRRRSCWPARRSFIWVSIAIVIGVYAAVRRYSLFDQALTFFSYIFFSLPTFWLGLMLIFIFAVSLALVPDRRDGERPGLAAVRHARVLGGVRAATRSRRSRTSAGTWCCR